MGRIFNTYKTNLNKIIGFLFLFCCLSVFFVSVTLHLPYSSDHASILLEAKSILDGNIFLKGWTLSTVSYYTTEIPFFIIGILIFGYSEKVIYIITGISYAFLAILIIILCSLDQKGNVSISRLVISLCFSFYIISLFSNWGLFSPVHIVSFAYCLCSIFLLRKLDNTFSYGGLLILSLILLITFVGDTFTIYIWGIPILIIMTGKFLFGKEKSKYAITLFSIIISIIISRIILNLIRQNGGFIVPGVEAKFVDYNNINNNLYLFFIGLFDLFSVNFFGQHVYSLNTLINAIHCIGLVIFIQAIIWSINNFRKLETVIQILLVGIFINLLEYLLADVAIWRGTVRYLLPTLIFSIFLIVFFIENNNWYQNRPIIMILTSIVIAMSLIPRMSLTRPDLPVSKLSSFLSEKNLIYGYGPYWVASITTVHSNEMVKIRAVTSSDNKYIRPFIWLAENDWYNENATFIVIDSTNVVEKPFNINWETAVNTFGQPYKTFRVDNYDILVWNRNISPDLFKNP